MHSWVSSAAAVGHEPPLHATQVRAWGPFPRRHQVLVRTRLPRPHPTVSFDWVSFPPFLAEDKETAVASSDAAALARGELDEDEDEDDGVGFDGRVVGAMI